MWRSLYCNGIYRTKKSLIRHLCRIRDDLFTEKPRYHPACPPQAADQLFPLTRGDGGGWRPKPRHRPGSKATGPARSLPPCTVRRLSALGWGRGVLAHRAPRLSPTGKAPSFSWPLTVLPILAHPSSFVKGFYHFYGMISPGKGQAPPRRGMAASPSPVQTLPYPAWRPVFERGGWRQACAGAGLSGPQPGGGWLPSAIIGLFTTRGKKCVKRLTLLVRCVIIWHKCQRNGSFCPSKGVLLCKEGRLGRALVLRRRRWCAKRVWPPALRDIFS